LYSYKACSLDKPNEIGHCLGPKIYETTIVMFDVLHKNRYFHRYTTHSMKYHYQFVSATKVRIELIPEDQKETALIEGLSASTENNEHLLELFRKGLEGYSSEAILAVPKFMSFPKVALCSYVIEAQTIDNLA
jgi:hypothetical protein